MIVMSDDFKKSVSATEREMKGYVEVSYTNDDVKDSATIVSYPNILEIDNTSISSDYIIDNDRKGKNYASLEQGYFKLDGTFVLPNNDATKNDGIGYTSEDIFEDDATIPTTPFNITVDTEEKVNALTLYFQNNPPISLQVDITADEGSFSYSTEYDDDITINDIGTATIVFGQDLTLQELDIYVKDVLYTNRRIRLQEIDFGLSAIYEGEDLISFKTIEQVSRFSYEMPMNECEVVLGDYEGKFDALNPQGITKYLTDSVIVKPYVGVVTKDNGIEYCKLGHYWLDNYNLSGNQVQFNCKDIFNKIQDEDFYITKGSGWAIWYLLENLSEDWGITIENKVGEILNNYIYFFADMRYKKISKKIDTLQKLATVCGNVFNADRDGNIVYIKSKNNTPEDFTITNDILAEYENIKIQEPIKDYKYNNYMLFDVDTSSSEYDGVQQRYNEKRQCNGLTTMYFQDENYCYESFKCYLICDDYSGLQIIDSNCYVFDENENILYEDQSPFPVPYMYVKFNYTGEMQCEIYGSKYKRITKAENTINCSIEGKDISIDNDLYAGSTNDPIFPDINFDYQNIVDYILENKSKYESKCKFNGNPAIECGDCIQVENKYLDENGNPRYDKVWVTKIESEYKGSFNQTIEGDILEN